MSSREEFLAEITGKMVNPILDKLAPFQGANARIWHYGVSHQHMHIRLDRDDGAHVYIVCTPCYRMEGPFLWNNAQLSVTMPLTNTWQLGDSGANFRLTCGRMLIVDEIEPGRAY